MARVTVENCLKKIPNRFQMILSAAYRSRQLCQGYAPLVASTATAGKTDKPCVTALREIADGKVGLEMLRKIQN